MPRRGFGGATIWAVGAAAWVWFFTVGCYVLFCFFVFFFFGVDDRLWVAGGDGVRCVVQWWW